MSLPNDKPASRLMVIVAFAIVYLVWGSTYYFIRVAIGHIPALLMAMMRFFTAGLLLMLWCVIRGERIFVYATIKPAFISGMLLLLIGNGAVVWVEQYLSSSLVAVLSAATPVWFVLLDTRNRKVNFKSKETVCGLLIGFIGVLLLFYEHAVRAFSVPGNGIQIVALCILLAGSVAWATGSLYSKYNSTTSSNTVNTAWQMLSAGIVFIPVSYIGGDWKGFSWHAVPASSWLALAYLIVMGSLTAYTAYVWLLSVRPATQVSTNAYVNPVVAVLLGVFLAEEKMSVLQIAGLCVILLSVLLVNLAKYRGKNPEVRSSESPEKKIWQHQPISEKI